MEHLPILKDFAQKIGVKKVRDYTYLALFFLVFSFFIFFAIRPVLTTAFSLQKEETDLKQLDQEYENTIQRLVSIQTNVEKVRDDVYLFEQAIPNKPNVNKIVQDLQASGSSSAAFTNTTIGEVSLVKKGSDQVKSLTINLTGSGSFDDFMNFTDELINQRRLKLIKTIDITKGGDVASSESGQLKISLDLTGFYL